MNIGNIYVNMLCVYMSICLISIHKSAPAHQFTKSANLQDEDWWLRHNNRASCKADPGFCYYVSLSYRARAGQSGSCGSGWFFLIFFWQREWQNLIGSHVYLWVELRWMADVCLECKNICRANLQVPWVVCEWCRAIPVSRRVICFSWRNSSQEFKSLKSKPRLMKALQGRGSVSLKACDFLSGVSIGGLPLSSHGFEL